MSHRDSSDVTGGNGSSLCNGAHSCDSFISDEARVVLEIVLFVFLSGTVGLLGSAVNVINIIVFFKQGFRDVVNISLFALAVSDLGSLLPLVWISICLNPLFQYSDIDFDPVDIHYLTGGMPHLCFVRITGLITAFVTFERCVCIALPLKVKNIITPRTTLISIVATVALVVSTNVPLFSSLYLAPYYNVKRNKTLIGLLLKQNTAPLVDFTYFGNAAIQMCSFIIVIICTLFLVLKLYAKSQWRNKAMFTSDVSDSFSTRDKRVMKMVTFISVIFIVCNFPAVVNFTLAVLLNQVYNYTGLYGNSYHISWGIIDTLSAINGSVNIFVYYNMSSKFRKTFKQLFYRSKTISAHK